MRNIDKKRLLKAVLISLGIIFGVMVFAAMLVILPWFKILMWVLIVLFFICCLVCAIYNSLGK